MKAREESIIHACRMSQKQINTRGKSKQWYTPVSVHKTMVKQMIENHPKEINEYRDYLVTLTKPQLEAEYILQVKLGPNKRSTYV